jgi:threonine dehydratase
VTAGRIVTSPMQAPTRADIHAAHGRTAGVALHTPLVASGDRPVWLKLEALQPYGSYKIRGAVNAVRARLEREPGIKAVVSASAGNFGQAIAATARTLGLPCIIHVPDNAARVKVASLERLGATVREHAFDDWWRIMQTRVTGDAGAFFHPVCEPEVIAGAATMGDEILADLPDVGAVLAPIGGGGLACGVATAIKLTRPGCRMIAVECETSLPLKAAFEAGHPVTVERRPSFIDGMGSTRVLDEMWPLLSRLIDEVVVVSVAEIEDAVRRLARDHHVVAEGAGAAALAASRQVSTPNTVCVVSGGNIDPGVLARILQA